MQDSAPDLVLGPNIRFEENQLVPKQPRSIIKSHREKHVLVDGDSGAPKRGEREEDDKRYYKCGQGHRESSNS